MCFEKLVESYSTLTGGGLLWDSIIIKDGYIGEVKEIRNDDNKLILILFNNSEVILTRDNPISHFKEKNSKFEFISNNIKYYLYRDYEEDDDEDDFEDDIILDIFCTNCNRKVSFSGECYCNKDDLSVTVACVKLPNNNSEYLIFNQFESKSMHPVYRDEKPDDLLERINKDDFSYLTDIIKDEKGFYFGEIWHSVYFHNKKNETAFNICSKCTRVTRVYYDGNKWLCKPCELALENKRKGYF